MIFIRPGEIAARPGEIAASVDSAIKTSAILDKEPNK